MSFYKEYADSLHQQLRLIEDETVNEIKSLLLDCWKQRKQVFICGNGGSAANALHIANDFTYGVNPKGQALDIEALSANNAVVSCLANDLGYDSVFSQQLISKGRADDVLIVLSGSGNSKNIIKALETASEQNMCSVAIVGYSGGQAKKMADIVIHNDIDDMQIAEDIQVIVGHWLMRSMYKAINHE